ncbi:MAG: galactosyldiacylglycerol synthase [Burkholderiales bacterium]|nr:galactosyldiacylglycerol synthase [Burkholderiales bacterium]
MTRVDLVYFNAGGGHRAAAQALQAVLAEREPGWHVRQVDLFRALDPRARMQRLTGLAPEDLYNKRLARGLTLGMAQELKLLQALIRVAHPGLVARLRPLWRDAEPDLVVSLVPNFNRALADSLAAERPGVPFVTVMTDLADYPPRFWIEPRHTQHLIGGSDRAIAQARAAGLPPAQLHRVSGMILRPAFHAAAAGDRSAQRSALGLDDATPVGVVMFGGHGAQAIDRIERDLPDRPLILMCGHHRRLAERLRERAASPAGAGRAARIVVGYTDEVSRWLRLADYFVGKPGPGSVSEALHCGLPVLTVHNAWTLPQERWNARWLQAQGLGIVLPGLRDVRAGVDALIDRMPALREAVARLPPNRALHEVPVILARIVDAASRAPPARAAGARGAAAAAPGTAIDAGVEAAH